MVSDVQFIEFCLLGYMNSLISVFVLFFVCGIQADGSEEVCVAAQRPTDLLPGGCGLHSDLVDVQVQ